MPPSRHMKTVAKIQILPNILQNSVEGSLVVRSDEGAQIK
jgi:hypothetical protein